ncbi:hypothetical protein WJM93_14160 [Lactiplantibacillus plantarum]|uniref:hypothetical protein n=1 Tax=Lactiplantibacillus plantarum TaxID=1590 RepID=UPI0021A43B68|nr:hypothetical protein [Lactiplantibacillus plantarum]MCT3206453.1 hypothetical protein [Lactiplantibacillus plantarum]MCT3220169.1 hypothetical protein [Lactiplantibacillus plantarum]MCT3281497.1 hypothetical protein [Lactiplantibacillus plantarum]
MNEKEFDLNIVNHFFEHDYHDRGLMKWQGFYLSDHTAALTKQRKLAQTQYPSKPQQSLHEITELLSKAYAEKKMVTLQLNEINNNSEHAADLHTCIHGYNEDSIIIDNQQFVLINDIQNISIN